MIVITDGNRIYIDNRQNTFKGGINGFYYKDMGQSGSYSDLSQINITTIMSQDNIIGVTLFMGENIYTTTGLFSTTGRIYLRRDFCLVIYERHSSKIGFDLYRSHDCTRALLLALDRTTFKSNHISQMIDVTAAQFVDSSKGNVYFMPDTQFDIFGISADAILMEDGRVSAIVNTKASYVNAELIDENKLLNDASYRKSLILKLAIGSGLSNDYVEVPAKAGIVVNNLSELGINTLKSSLVSSSSVVEGRFPVYSEFVANVDYEYNVIGYTLQGSAIDGDLLYMTFDEVRTGVSTGTRVVLRDELVTRIASINARRNQVGLLSGYVDVNNALYERLTAAAGVLDSSIGIPGVFDTSVRIVATPRVSVPSALRRFSADSEPDADSLITSIATALTICEACGITVPDDVSIESLRAFVDAFASSQPGSPQDAINQQLTSQVSAQFSEFNQRLNDLNSSLNNALIQNIYINDASLAEKLEQVGGQTDRITLILNIRRRWFEHLNLTKPFCILHSVRSASIGATGATDRITLTFRLRPYDLGFGGHGWLSSLWSSKSVVHMNDLVNQIKVCLADWLPNVFSKAPGTYSNYAVISQRNEKFPSATFYSVNSQEYAQMSEKFRLTNVADSEGESYYYARTDFVYINITVPASELINIEGLSSISLTTAGAH